MPDYAYHIIATLLFIIGIVGCIIPYPGHLFILLGCITASVGQPELHHSWVFWLVMLFLMLAGALIDNLFIALGAKKFGCSNAAIWGSLAGAIIGCLFFPFGLLIGPFLGAFLVEYFYMKRELKHSSKASLGALLGFFAGVLAKLIIATVMISLQYFTSF